MVERSLSMREVPGSIPGASRTFPIFMFSRISKTKIASSGNRTRAARVAGEHSTTEPTMLVFFDAMQQYSSCGRVVKATDSKSVSLWERRFESYRLRQHFFSIINSDIYKILMYSLFLVAFQCGIVGSVVECSPATRAAWVRFPADATFD